MYKRQISLPEIDDLNTNQPVVLDKEETEEEKEIVLRESGWIPNWGFDLGFESLQNNKDIIDTVNPVLYSVDGYGNVVSRGVSQSNIEMLLEYCKKNNIRVIPTVGSVSYTHLQWGPKPKIFAKLDLLEQGDRLSIADSEKKIKFEVLNSLVIDPEALWQEIAKYHIAGKENRQSFLIIITCTPYGTDLMRLIVILERIE